jgi:hypothetical protein
MHGVPPGSMPIDRICEAAQAAEKALRDNPFSVDSPSGQYALQVARRRIQLAQQSINQAIEQAPAAQ